MHSSPDAAPNDTELMEQAALWLLKMDNENCTEQERLEFIAWQHISPRHQATVEKMQSTFGALRSFQQQHADPIPHHIIEHAVQHSRSERLFKPQRLLTLAGLVLMSAMLWRSLPTDYWFADTRTTYNTWTEQRLPDNSDIKISGQTAYNLAFDQQRRTVDLLGGNILVDVEKDTSRPFIIKTHFAQIKALGTRFIVQHHPQATVLTMLHSTTEVTAQVNGITQVRRINAGEQIIIDSTGTQPIRRIAPDLLEQTWKEQMLMIDLMPLDQVLGILQSYENTTLKYDAEQLHPIEVTAVLPLDGKGLDLLQRSLPISTEHDFLGRTVVKLKNAPHE